MERGNRAKHRQSINRAHQAVRAADEITVASHLLSIGYARTYLLEGEGTRYPVAAMTF